MFFMKTYWLTDHMWSSICVGPLYSVPKVRCKGSKISKNDDGVLLLHTIPTFFYLFEV